MVFRACMVGLSLLVVGCADPETNTNVPNNVVGPSLELDSEVIAGESAPQFGSNLKRGSITNEFDLDLLDPRPPKHFDRLHLSASDEIYIALQTLDYIDSPRRYLIATADKLDIKSMPTLRGLQGYKPRLIVEGNSLFVEVQSEDKPIRYARPVPIDFGPDEIVVGGIVHGLNSGFKLVSSKGFFSQVQLHDGYVGYNWNGLQVHSGYNNRMYQRSAVSGVRYHYSLASNLQLDGGIETVHAMKSQKNVLVGRAQVDAKLSFGTMGSCIAYADNYFIFGVGVAFNMGQQAQALKSNIAFSKGAMYCEILLSLEY